MPSLSLPRKKAQAQPQPAARRRTRRGEELRLKILAEATELFLLRGYEGVSLADILDRVGGSKTNFYTFFGNKDGLFLEAMNALIDDLLVPVAEAVRLEPSLPEALSSLGRALLNMLLTPRHIAYQRLVLSGSAHHPAVGSHWYRHGPARTHGLIAHVILHFQRAGAVRPGLDPHLAAVLFHDMITFDLLLRTLLVAGEKPSASAIDAKVDQAVSLFLAAIGTSSGKETP
jgi:AcrR family transcriptional regulator